MSYFDDEGKWVDEKVYANLEKIDKLFETIDNETWYYTERKMAVGEHFCISCYDSRNTNRELLFIDVYSNCISVEYYMNGESLRLKFVTPADGESDVYEKTLAIVDDIKSQDN